jgi:hypothetical protein
LIRVVFVLVGGVGVLDKTFHPRMAGLGAVRVGVLLLCSYACFAILDDSVDSSFSMPEAQQSRLGSPDRRDITDLTDADDGRNETAYELKIMDKMRKMDLWVQDLSAGERTRIQEVSSHNVQ